MSDLRSLLFPPSGPPRREPTLADLLYAPSGPRQPEPQRVMEPSGDTAAYMRARTFAPSKGMSATDAALAASARHKQLVSEGMDPREAMAQLAREGLVDPRMAMMAGDPTPAKGGA